MQSICTQAPPQYSEVADEDTALLAHLSAALNHERNTDTTSEAAAEVSRVKNFIQFVLSLDYQCYIGASLSSADRAHFTQMSSSLWDLNLAHDSTKPTNAERKTLAAYFSQYLHAPCQALGIPTDYFVVLMARFVKYQTSFGRYKGCCFAVLHNLGVGHLASKLYMDKMTIVPRIVADRELQRTLLTGIADIQGLYFDSVEGFDSSTADTGRGNGQLQTINYEPNERGRAYEDSRDGATSRSHRGLSTRHWALRARICTQGILHRHQLVKAGKRVADKLFTWKGDGNVLPPEGTRLSTEANVPFGWVRLKSVHVPDCQENRSIEKKSEL